MTVAIELQSGKINGGTIEGRAFAAADRLMVWMIDRSGVLIRESVVDVVSGDRFQIVMNDQMPRSRYDIGVPTCVGFLGS